MPKLQAKISQELHDLIIQAKIELDSGKGKVLQHLLELAVSNPEAVKRDFGETEDKSCTLQFSGSDWTNTQSYRSRYSLDTKVSFFKDALERGASVFIDLKEADSSGQSTSSTNGAAPVPSEDGDANTPSE